MKIVSNFLFFDEFELLEIKLATEYDHVDKFLIVESDHTFTGIHKGYNLPLEIERYAQWWDKVVYLQIGQAPYQDPWQVSAWNRAHFYTQWGDLTKEDVIISADLDEIVRPETFKFIRETDYDLYHLGTPYFSYKFNNMMTDKWKALQWTPWHRMIASRGQFVQHDGMRGFSPGHWPYQNSTPGKTAWLHHAGWHFSNVMSNERLVKKTESFEHTDWNVPAVLSKINVDLLTEQGTAHWPEPVKFSKVKLDDYFPKYILDNREKFKAYITDDGEQSVRDIIPGDLPHVLSNTDLSWKESL